MLANLTMDLIFTNVDIESPPIDTPLLICLTRSYCSVMLKGLLNYSTDNLEIPSRRYVAASIGSLFTSNRRNLHSINCNINSDMFYPNFPPGKIV